MGIQKAAQNELPFLFCERRFNAKLSLPHPLAARFCTRPILAPHSWVAPITLLTPFVGGTDHALSRHSWVAPITRWGLLAKFLDSIFVHAPSVGGTDRAPGVAS
jgi:hypothetical protein